MAGARDGQLRMRRGADSPPWALQMFDDEVGLWLTLCQADEEEEMIRAGIPILRGPYVVNYSDIPHDGDTKTLWTPQVGDILLSLFPDVNNITQWDHGKLYIGPNVDGTTIPPTNNLVSDSAAIGIATNADALDFLQTATYGNLYAPIVGNVVVSGYVFGATNPVQIQLAQTGGTDPTRGHVELYALVARAAAP